MGVRYKHISTHDRTMSNRKYKYPNCYCHCLYFKVYTLTDKYGDVFYVGCTSQSLKQRLSCHKIPVNNQLAYNNVRKADKIASLNGEVFINLIEEKYMTQRSRRRSVAPMADREQYWIKKYMEMGYTLCNKEAYVKSKAA